MNYKYNPESMSKKNPLQKVKIWAHINSGFDKVSMNPEAQTWLAEEYKVIWDLDSIGAAKSKGSIVAQFELDNGPTEFGEVDAEFKGWDNSFSGVTIRSEPEILIRETKTRVFSSEYGFFFFTLVL